MLDIELLRRAGVSGWHVIMKIKFRLELVRGIAFLLSIPVRVFLTSHVMPLQTIKPDSAICDFLSTFRSAELFCRVDGSLFWVWSYLKTIVQTSVNRDSRNCVRNERRSSRNYEYKEQEKLETDDSAATATPNRPRSSARWLILCNFSFADPKHLKRLTLSLPTVSVASCRPFSCSIRAPLDSLASLVAEKPPKFRLYSKAPAAKRWPALGILWFSCFPAVFNSSRAQPDDDTIRGWESIDQWSEIPLTSSTQVWAAFFN